MKKFTTLLTVLALLVAGLNAQTPVKIFMIGDSTMANKPLENDNQERGWGQMLGECFSAADVTIDNHAVNGRSTLSFITDGRWDKVLSQIKPGDYVFIQFGHNDEKPDEKRHTEPGSSFDANLRKFCVEAREKGGIPVLYNSIVRRSFFVNENAVTEDDNFGKGITLKTEGNKLVETHVITHEDGSKADYLASPRNVAAELGVPFIDANKITHDFVESFGPELSKKFFCWIPAGTNLAAPNGREDNTHLNILGARVVAALLANATCEEVPALKPYLRYINLTEK